MKKTMLTLALCGATLTALAQTPRLQKIWETDTVLHTPESVLPHGGRLYVSNMGNRASNTDGDGFIARLRPDGRVETLRWAAGLNAPKGMGVVGNKLYVADPAEVAVIDLKTGSIIEKIKIDGVRMLNDISIKGNDVYVSDSQGGKVYVLRNGKTPEVFVEDAQLEGPNGVRWVGNRFYVIDARKGILWERMPDKSLKQLAEGMPSGDGIEPHGRDLILSRWQGVMHYYKADGTLLPLLDTQAQKKNTADIGFDPTLKIVYVPTFLGNTVAAYQLLLK